jgi:AcrR family transcriptional regulator
VTQRIAEQVYAHRVSTRPDRRTEILHTAARMYAVSGFHGVSIDDLGGELGISGPAIYRYFAGKEAILGEMLVDISRRLLDGARTRIAEHDEPADQLSALIDFHAAFALSEPELIAVQYRDLGSASELDRRRVRQLQSQYVGIWEDVLLAVYPGVTQKRARGCAHAVFGLLNSTPHSVRPGEPGMAGALRDMAAAALAAGCTAP